MANKTIEQRKEVAQNVTNALNKAIATFNTKHGSQYALCIDSTNYKDVFVECKFLNGSIKGRFQVWVTSKNVVMFLGDDVKAIFDNAGFSLFNSQYVESRIDKDYKWNVNSKGEHVQSKIKFEHDDFIPLFLNTFCAMFSGENVDIDKAVNAINASVAQTDSKTASDSKTDSKTDSKSKRQTDSKSKTDSKTRQSKSDSKSKTERQSKSKTDRARQSKSKTETA